jgi:hypothetical protein
MPAQERRCPLNVEELAATAPAVPRADGSATAPRYGPFIGLGIRPEHIGN